MVVVWRVMAKGLLHLWCECCSWASLRGKSNKLKWNSLVCGPSMLTGALLMGDQIKASHKEARLFSHSTTACYYIKRHIWVYSIVWKPAFSDGHGENDWRKSKIKIKTVIIQQHRPCWNIVRADLGGMPTISPSEHPGGGMSWKDEERLPSETHFSTHLKQAGPDHRFSPPTPSVCKYLGRGHILWVAHLGRFRRVFFKS